MQVQIPFRLCTYCGVPRRVVDTLGKPREQSGETLPRQYVNGVTCEIPVLLRRAGSRGWGARGDYTDSQPSSQAGKNTPEHQHRKPFHPVFA